MLTRRRPLRVAVLCSRRALGLTDLLTGRRVVWGRPSSDRPTPYEIVCCLTAEDRFDEQGHAEAHGIPVRSHSIRRFCEARGASLYRDPAVRAAYDAATVRILAPYEPDVLLLAGYLYLVTEPLLAAFPGRLLNLHLSDLTLRTTDGRPRFPGLRAVRDALVSGQPVTRATVHQVTDGADEGAPLVLSWGFRASPLVDDARTCGATDMLKAYAFAHQEWMIRAASGPLWSAALALLASGEADLDALAAADPAAVVPWVLSRRGHLERPVDGAHGTRARQPFRQCGRPDPRLEARSWSPARG